MVPAFSYPTALAAFTAVSPILAFAGRVKSHHRGFLQHLLVASLDGAVTLSQMDHIAVLVGHDLELHMPWLFNVFLNIHGVVGKSLHRLHLGRVKELGKVLRASQIPHALAAAAG